MTKIPMKSTRKKKRGRPATGRDPVASIRISPQLRKNIDEWSSTQPDNPSLSEAVRRLVDHALAHPPKSKR
jgi:hypothetical protein